MSGINKVIIVGRLGQDPEVRYSQAGNAVANMSVATSKKYQGNEETEWHRVVAFSKVAEICQQYLHKGDLVGFEGELRTRKWQDQQGNDRWSTEIIVHKMDMLGSKRDANQAPAGNQSAPPRQPQASDPDPQTDFDDIPF